MKFGPKMQVKALVGYLTLFSSVTSLLIIIFWSKHNYRRFFTISIEGVTGITAPHTFLTIFTSFDLNRTKPYKTFAHKMAIKNWSVLKPDVQPVLFHNETDHELVKMAADSNWDLLNLTSFNEHGTPKLIPMFTEIFCKYDSTFYGYVNGDILFSENLVSTLRGIEKNLAKLDNNVLVIGIRKNLDLNLTLPEETYQHGIDELGLKARLFEPHAIDYFFFSAGNVLNWTSLANVVIGRPAYDSYLVSMAIETGVNVIDATKTLLALHLSTPNVSREGFNNPDWKYNRGIIGRFNYGKGHTHEAKLLTVFDAFKEVFVISR